MRLLVCDDSVAIRSKIKRTLTSLGYEAIELAKDGYEAFEQYKAFKPDIVILDLVMPNVDGKTALSNIMKFDPSAKVIISSSLGSEQDIEECLSLGAVSYIQKPFDEAALGAVIKTIGFK